MLEGDTCYRKKKLEQNKCYWIYGRGVQFQLGGQGRSNWEDGI